MEQICEYCEKPKTVEISPKCKKNCIGEQIRYTHKLLEALSIYLSESDVAELYACSYTAAEQICIATEYSLTRSGVGSDVKNKVLKAIHESSQAEICIPTLVSRILDCNFLSFDVISALMQRINITELQKLSVFDWEDTLGLSEADALELIKIIHSRRPSLTYLLNRASVLS